MEHFIDYAQQNNNNGGRLKCPYNGRQVVNRATSSALPIPKLYYLKLMNFTSSGLKEALTKIANEFGEERMILETLTSKSTSQYKAISEEQLLLSYTKLEEAKDYLKQYPNDALIIDNVAWQEDGIAFWKAHIENAEIQQLLDNALAEKIVD